MEIPSCKNEYSLPHGLGQVTQNKNNCYAIKYGSITAVSRVFSLIFFVVDIFGNILQRQADHMLAVLCSEMSSFFCCVSHAGAHKGMSHFNIFLPGFKTPAVMMHNDIINPVQPMWTDGSYQNQQKNGKTISLTELGNFLFFYC